MSLAASPAAARPAPARVLLAEPLFAAGGVVILLSMAPTLAAMALDARQFQGDSVWLKPVKFQLALVVYLLSLAVFAAFMPQRVLGGWPWRAFSIAVLVAIAAELAWIGGAAMAGTASHFNVETPLMATLYPLMGAFAVLLTSASLAMGILVWHNRESGLSPALHLSVALGLVLTFLMTVPVAGTLASMPGHFVGTPVTGAALPVFGWSREVGDLRAAHFLATHAMHLLPLAGLAALPLSDRAGRGLVWAAAAGFVLLVAVVFARALAGLPVIPA